MYKIQIKFWCTAQSKPTILTVTCDATTELPSFLIFSFVSFLWWKFNINQFFRHNFQSFQPHTQLPVLRQFFYILLLVWTKKNIIFLRFTLNLFLVYNRSTFHPYFASPDFSLISEIKKLFFSCLLRTYFLFLFFPNGYAYTMFFLFYCCWFVYLLVQR